MSSGLVPPRPRDLDLPGCAPPFRDGSAIGPDYPSGTR